MMSKKPLICADIGSMATTIRAGRSRDRGSILSRERDLFLLQNVKRASGARRALYSVGTGDSSAEIKAAVP
jgi:hypothetical protein